MLKKPHFRLELFKFLKDLKKNNRKDWFTANKARYEADVRDPCLQFIADFGPHLQKISRHFIADSRPMGGSLFRIYRDVRFSKDKSPYKTMAGVHFRHDSGGDAHSPGFYLHLEPGDVFMGTGLWHPDTESLAKIRRAIVAQPKRWKRILSEKEFKTTFWLWGESLKRPPAGFDQNHPLIEDLKRKDFVALAQLSEKEACDPGFMDRFAELCGIAAPFTKFLTAAVELPW